MAPFKRILPGKIAPVINSMGLIGAGATKVASRVAGEIARALPDSKGAEIPKDLQRWRASAYDIFTTTVGQSVNFYSADQWVRMKLVLETAGPVAIGLGNSDILPVLSGKGRLLDVSQEWEVYLPKGARVYYAASSVNRVGVTIEPVPWLEQISMQISAVAGAVSSVLSAMMSGKPAVDVPASLAPKTKLQQLTKMDVPGKL